MISILIPTHDYNAYPLVHTIHEQAEKLAIQYEIILVEDGSHDTVSMIANLKTKDLSNCRYIRRNENIGRSAIRNFLISESKGDMLLFMDSDGKIINDDFIAKYVEYGKSYDVVCGGVTHPDVWLDPNRMLRWKYEKSYEQKHGTISEQFRSFSFMIKREVADTVKFDERYSNYGYEDVKYGEELKKAGYNIKCINNPLLNKDIEESKVFIRKTEEALHSAKQFESELCNCVKLIQFYNKYKIMMPVVSLFFKLTRNMMMRNLISKNPSVSLFYIYKLGYYASL